VTANTSNFVILIARDVKLERLTCSKLLAATTIGKSYNKQYFVSHNQNGQELTDQTHIKQ